MFEHGAAKGGLAGPDFAGDLDKAFALANAVKEMVERFAMLEAEEEKTGVRGDVKRRFFQTVILQIHG